MIFMALFWTCSSRSMSFLRAGGLRAEHSTLKEQVPWRWRECSSCSKHFSGREPSHLASSPCYPEVFLDRASSFPTAHGMQSLEQSSPGDNPSGYNPSGPPGSIPARSSPRAPLTPSPPAQGFSKLPPPRTEAPQRLQTPLRIHHPTQGHLNQNTWQWTICSLLIKN